MDSGFYSREELAAVGLKSFGENVLISRRASIYNPGVISLGSHVRIDDFVLLSGGEGITLGTHVHIGAYSALFAGAGIVLEDFAGLSPRVTLLSESDDIMGRSLTGPTISMKYKPAFRRGPIVLRRHSGAAINSTILPGVELAEGAVLGPHSLAAGNLPAWTVSFGAPVNKTVRRRRNVLDLERQFVADLAAERGLPQQSD